MDAENEALEQLKAIESLLIETKKDIEAKELEVKVLDALKVLVEAVLEMFSLAKNNEERLSDESKAEICALFPRVSKILQDIANYVKDNPNQPAQPNTAQPVSLANLNSAVKPSRGLEIIS